MPANANVSEPSQAAAGSRPTSPSTPTPVITNVYECMFLLDTNKVAGDVTAAAQQLHTTFQKNNAEVLASRPWDERRLAYPIKNHKKGLYYLTYFRTEGKNLVNIGRDLTLNETVLRSLVLHVDPKMVETMLALARDEHALALHAIHEEPGEGALAEGEGGEGGDEHRGPRRGRRPQPAGADDKE
jgi:small subunit ribosomal protein S6